VLPAFVIVAAVISLGPRLARAQPGVPLPGMMPGGVLLPAEMGECCNGFRTGYWAEYLVSRRGGESWHLRFAAVGREGAAWWLEMTMSQARRGEATVRMLINEGEGSREDRIQRLIIQPNRQIPLEIPIETSGEALPPLDRGTGPATLVGTEQLRLQPGTFTTRHYRRGEGEEAHHIWLSDDVALWGLARYVSPRVRLVLVGQGRGAVSRVTGEPVPFDPSILR
jgi:hypothetical protein